MLRLGSWSQQWPPSVPRAPYTPAPPVNGACRCAHAERGLPHCPRPCAVASELAYVYTVANFTTLILRMQQRLEQYRFKLKGVDQYLRRNRVSKEVRKRVQRFFRRSLENESNDDQIIAQMPGSLRREVMQDINMRTLRRVPLFFGCESEALGAVCGVLRRLRACSDGGPAAVSR